MKNLIAGFPGFAVCCLLLSGLSGCGDTTPVLSADVTIDVPEQFEDGGAQWQRQAALQKSDTDCLARFFELNGELAGSPELEGSPVLFTSGQSNRRFYWLQTLADGERWRCVCFTKGKFSNTEGTGSPFR